MIELIAARSKCTVTLEVNPHRNMYESAETWLNDYVEQRAGEVRDQDRPQMIESDTIYVLQFYPNTPIGFYSIVGPTYYNVIVRALSVLDLEKL